MKKVVAFILLAIQYTMLSAQPKEDLIVKGNIGAGINLPETRLHIRSSQKAEGITIDAINPILQLRQSNFPFSGYTEKGFIQLEGSNIRIGTYGGNSSGKFIIRNNGGDRVFVNAEGKMGINMTDPLAFLHINSGPSTATLRLQGDANPTLQFYKGNASVGSIQVSGNDLRFSAPGNNVVLNGLMYVDGSNNRVGINTSTPGNNLHVQGDAKVSSGKIYNNDGVNMLPIAWAKFNRTGGRLAGTSNISAVVKHKDGYYDTWYEITVDGVDLSGSVMSANATGVPLSNLCFVQATFSFDSPTKGGVYIHSLSAEKCVDGGFDIIIYK